MSKLILFDVDGTLLWTDGAGRRALHRALWQEMGTAGPIEAMRFDGKTDRQIIRELLVGAGHPDARSEMHLERICRRYLTLLVEELEISAPRSRQLPGVAEMLGALEARGDAVIGLLTGNLAEGAALKLKAVGIDPARFRVGAYGSDSADRPDLPPIAVARALDFMGRAVSGPDLVIIGDTPSDVTCGRALEARAIGVATGSYTVDDLLAAGAFAAFDSLTDVGAVMAAIYT